MPAKIAHALVIVAAVLIVGAVVSLRMDMPLLWFSARHLGGGAGLMLLMSLALHQCSGPCRPSQ